MKNLFDYDVYDRNGNKVGSVENVWANEDKEIGFIGISTGWLGLGKNHILPANDFTIDEEAQVIRVPYDEDTIKNSPSFESTDDLEDDVESRVYSHYGVTGSHLNKSTGASSSASTTDYAAGSGSSAYGTTGYAAGSRTDTSREHTEHGESVEVPLAEERINVQKRETNLGEVRLRKVVRTETVNQPVELRHEEVVVERVNTAARPGEDAFVEKVISIPVSEEQAVIEKTVHSAGAVQANKVVQTEQKNVSGTVRKEDVEVERNYSTERKDKNIDTGTDTTIETDKRNNTGK